MLATAITKRTPSIRRVRPYIAYVRSKKQAIENDEAPAAEGRMDGSGTNLQQVVGLSESSSRGT